MTSVAQKPFDPSRLPGVILPGYEPLYNVLLEALNQAQSGKGKERHANDEPFDQQEICTEARKLGLGAPAFQVRKKVREAIRLYETKGPLAAIPDLLGAINYAAAMVIVIRQMALSQTKNAEGGTYEEDRRTICSGPDRVANHQIPGGLISYGSEKPDAPGRAGA